MGMANNRNITIEETMDPNMLGEVVDYQEKGLISGSLPSFHNQINQDLQPSKRF